jgi:hypothetical protein
MEAPEVLSEAESSTLNVDYSSGLVSEFLRIQYTLIETEDFRP